MPTNLRTIVARTLAVPVLILLVLAIALAAWIAHMTRAEAWVQHTYNVTGMINESERFLIDQETGLRGYLLGGDPRFLQPYDAGRMRFGKSLHELARETDDNPGQQRRIATVREAYRRWFSSAEAERAAAKSGSATARDAVFAERMVARRQEMDGMRAVFGELRMEEQRLLTERVDLAGRANTTLLYAGAALVIVCSVLVFIFLRMQLAEIDRIYIVKVEESERARHAAEELAAEVREQAAAMEDAVLTANRDRDNAIRNLSENGRP